MKKDEQELKPVGLKRELEGVVVSSAMDKSIVVTVQTYRKHPHYGKYVQRGKKYTAHDETNTCGVGDKVLIKESRPISKSKRWRLHKIVAKAK